MIKRDWYLDKLIKRAWDGNVKVITGIRRCGKSVLLFDIYKSYLLAEGVKQENIIEIKLDKMEFISFRNPFILYKEINKIINKNPLDKYYLFIDEVQMAIEKKDRKSGVIANIYDILNGFKDNKNIDVYVTGSNSKMLSKDISTEFRGRSSQIHVFPLSFSEYYNYIGGDVNEALNDYMVLGGMPGAVHEKTVEDKKNYLVNLFNEIYIKDILERNRIQRVDILNDILDYLSSQISSLTNSNRIANSISTLKKEKVTFEMVSKYVNHTIDSFIINMARRYDVKGKSYFEYPNKYYYIDNGLRNARLNFRQNDPGHLMENILYNELIRRGCNVDVGAIPLRTHDSSDYVEIDFVVNKLDFKVYIQSAFRMDNEEKITSEIKPLTITGDSFKKVIIRNDILSSYYDEQGILHCKFTDFLLDKINILD
jgi:hypothetical protein